MTVHALIDGSCTSVGGTVMINNISSEPLFPQRQRYKVMSIGLQNGIAYNFCLQNEKKTRMVFKSFQLYGGEVLVKESTC